MFFKRVVFLFAVFLMAFPVRAANAFPRYDGSYIAHATNMPGDGLLVDGSVFIRTDRLKGNAPKSTFSVKYDKDVVKTVRGKRGTFSIFRVLAQASAAGNENDRRYRYILVQKGKKMISVYFIFDTDDADKVSDASVPELFPTGFAVYADRAFYRGPVTDE